MTSGPIIGLRDLHVDIQRDGRVFHPVRGVSFDLYPGETLGLAGESGSGKSLTLLSILGLLPRGAKRRASEITFDGEDLASIPARRMRRLMATGIATIFQDPMTSLNPVLTIGSVLEEVYLVHRGGPRSAARDRAVEMLEKVDVPQAAARLRQYPHELSGGLRQRVMIAMALMCEPKVLFADEPTTALDVTVQAGVLDLIARLQRELGLAVILVSHDLGVVERLAHRIAIMYAGQIVEMGPTRQVLGTPAHPYTRALIGCIPSVRGTAHLRLEPIPGQVPVLEGKLSGCQFRNRCASAMSICGIEAPPVRGMSREWHARCHLDGFPVSLPAAQGEGR